MRRQDGSTTVHLPGGEELTLAGGTVTATRYYSFNGQVVAVRTGPGTAGVSTLVADHHGTAGLSVANTTRQVSRRYTDPYGAPRGTAPAVWAGDHGFLDKPVDDTGLVQVGARYYDPTTGRFVSVDPVMDLADPQQWHGYAYANNNPTTWSDPTGLRPMVDDGGGVRYANGSLAYQGDTKPYTPGYVPVAPKTVVPPISVPAGYLPGPVVLPDAGAGSTGSGPSRTSGTSQGEAVDPFRQSRFPPVWEPSQWAPPKPLLPPSDQVPGPLGPPQCEPPGYESDWGTGTAGAINFLWGWFKVGKGFLQALSGHPIIGGYNIASGEVKAANGAVQMWQAGTEGCGWRDCSTAGNLQRLVTSTVPGGTWTDEHLNWWERVGSLP